MTTVHRRHRLRAAWVAIGAAAGLLLAGCSNDGKPLTTLDPQGEPARWIDNLFVKVMIVAGIVFVLVEGAVIVLVIRYRRRRHDVDGVDEPVQVHGNSRLEWGWTIAPAVILAVLAVFNIQTLWDVQNAQADAPTQIQAIGQQWWWEFRYDLDADGEPDVITAQQLVIPTGQTIRIQTASNDVIHSFWIPALNGKRDAVPGRTSGVAIQADEPGIYQGQCTEYCGLSHGYMRMEVKALSPADYQVWLANQVKGSATPVPGSKAAEGKDLFFQRCAGCHQINGYDSVGDRTGTDIPDPDYLGPDQPLTSGNAPNLTHLMSRNRFAGNMFPLWVDPDGFSGPVAEGTPDEGSLAAWLKNPPELKPMAPDQNRGMPNLGLTPEEIDKLVAYLITLK